MKSGLLINGQMLTHSLCPSLSSCYIILFYNKKNWYSLLMVQLLVGVVKHWFGPPMRVSALWKKKAIPIIWKTIKALKMLFEYIFIRKKEISSDNFKWRNSTNYKFCKDLPTIRGLLPLIIFLNSWAVNSLFSDEVTFSLNEKVTSTRILSINLIFLSELAWFVIVIIQFFIYRYKYF